VVAEIPPSENLLVFPRFTLISTCHFPASTSDQDSSSFVSSKQLGCCLLPHQGIGVALSKAPRYTKEFGPIPFIYNCGKEINKNQEIFGTGIWQWDSKALITGGYITN